MRARKRFGQNFLHDSSVIQKIVQAVTLSKCDHLVEIGPGEGVLTTAFLKNTLRFDLVELDRDLIPRIKEICREEKSCFIHQHDALDFDFKSIFTGQKMRFIGNLPYNISTPLLFHILEFKDYVQDMHFMLQREVAERIIAQPNTKDYGRLSIMLQYNCEAEMLFDVPPEAFYPIPKVHSSFIRLTPRQVYQNPVASWPIFQNVVREAFNYRRKTISNALKTMLPKKELELLSIDPHARPEQLAIADFVKMSNFLAE